MAAVHDPGAGRGQTGGGALYLLELVLSVRCIATGGAIAEE